VLFDFGGGIQWWFVDRGYCSDEGRSGKHCGNVVGQYKPDQRLLSLRKDGHVLLTFVLEPGGTLGEMKARGNQKPSEKYHPYIIKLLMWDRVTGITGEGYLPDANFSMFDLSEKNLAYIDANKPQLISNQCRITPIEILRAPASIQEKYQGYINNISIRSLIVDSSTTNWSYVTAQDPGLILYAPHDIPDFENRLLKYCLKPNRDLLLKAPNSIARNTELLNKILAVNGMLIAGVNPSVRGYRDLCLTAVKENSNALGYVPKELRDRDLCIAAIEQDGSALHLVPEELRDKDLYMFAVKKKGEVLRYVPEQLKDREICRAAVNQDGRVIQYVPNRLQDREICLTAVKQNGEAIHNVPKELRDRDMCLIAIKTYGGALQLVPDGLLDREMCLTAVKIYGRALGFVPDRLRDREMWSAAIEQDGDMLQYAPEELRDRKICMAAVKTHGEALASVPDELVDRKMCMIAVKNDGGALRFVPLALRDREICLAAVKQNGWVLRYVPEELRDREICLTAVEQDGYALEWVPNELRYGIRQHLNINH
jgi:hypothetical protein